MAKRSVEDAALNRRGSPEAIAKRRAGRAFNDLWQPSSTGMRLDGRTEKRRQRLLKELEQGKTRGSGRELKPLDVLTHVSELLELGVPLAVIRKACRTQPVLRSEAPLVEVVARLHQAYAFRAEAYRFVGLDDGVLRAAGVLGDARRPRGIVARSTRRGADGTAVGTTEPRIERRSEPAPASKSERSAGSRPKSG